MTDPTREKAAFAILLGGLIVISATVGASLRAVHGGMDAANDALRDARTEAALREWALRRTQDYLNETAAHHLYVAAVTMEGLAEAQSQGASPAPRHFQPIEDRLTRARAFLQTPTGRVNATVIASINATLDATGWVAAAAGAGVEPTADRVRALARAADALRNLSASLTPHDDRQWLGTEPPRELAGILLEADRDLRIAHEPAAREAIHDSVDVQRVQWPAPGDDGQLRVTVTGAIPANPNGPWWFVEACATGLDASRKCHVSGHHRSALHTDSWRNTVNATTVDDHTVQMAAPRVTENTTGLVVLVKADLNDVPASDGCVFTPGDGGCDDPKGDTIACVPLVGRPGACRPGAPHVTLAFQLDTDAFAANGTVHGNLTLENRGAHARVLPPVPNATLHVEVVNASTGETVPWYGSAFSAREPFTDNDLRGLSTGDTATWRVTYPGGWLVEAGGEYRVTATYRPGHTEGVGSGFWRLPLSATLIVAASAE